MTEKEEKIKHLRKVESKLSGLTNNSKDIDKLRDLLYNEMLDEKKSDNPYSFYVNQLNCLINEEFDKLLKIKNKKEQLKICVDRFIYLLNRYITHIS